MTNTILVTVTIDSYDHFIETFSTRGLALREKHGSRGAQVHRHVDDPERLTLVFDWDAPAFQGFLQDPDVQASMRESGTLGPPQIVVLESPTSLPA